MQNHLLLHVARSGGAAVAIDVGAVRIDADRHDLGAEFVEHGRRDTVGRPMGTVDHDLETVQAKTAREAMLDELDVTSGASSSRFARPSSADGARPSPGSAISASIAASCPAHSL